MQHESARPRQQIEPDEYEAGSGVNSLSGLIDWLADLIAEQRMREVLEDEPSPDN